MTDLSIQQEIEKMGIDLKKLSPAALSAAMRGGTDAWGKHGSIFEHVLYIERLDPKLKRWRMCRCGCRKRSTHMVMANGIGMASGCELEMKRFVKKCQKMGLMA